MENPGGTMSRLAVHCSLLLSLIFIAATPALAQDAQLSGRVTDPSGAVIANARIEVRNQATSASRATTTNADGLYVVPFLTPGVYTISADASGFKRFEQREVKLEAAQQGTIDLKLEVGSSSEAVTVNGDIPLINTSDASVSTVVDRQFVENMPLNGRTLQSLISDAPGIVTTPTPVAGEQGQFSSVGQRAGSNYFSIDAVSANFGVEVAQYLAEGANGGLPALSALGTTSSLVSIDALQEFRLESSTYAPEYGRGSGAQVILVTRSGTNRFHGSGFDYFRNDALDATDWFANSTRQPKPKERQNDFGGVFGGPIIKDKTFFFFSYEGLRVTQPIFQISDVPSLAARANAPPDIQTIFNAFPLPNGPNTGPSLTQLATSSPNRGTLNATSVRIDHTINSKMTLFGRFNHSPSVLSEAFAGFPSDNPMQTNVSVDATTIGLNALLTSAVANDFRVNYSRAHGSQRQSIDNFGGATPPAAGALLSPWQDPVTSNTAIFFFDGRNMSPLAFGLYGNNLNRQWNVTDSVSVTTGNHLLKFGGDFRRLTPIQRLPSTFDLYGWIATAEATAGAIPDFTQVLQDHSNIQQLYRNLSGFAQDTWKFLPRLTLTYGVRWDYNPPPTETNGNANAPYALSEITDLSKATLQPRGTPLWHADWKNFAPRMGMAYQFGEDKRHPLVLRAGFGQFYDLGTDTAAFLNNGEGWFPWGISTNVCLFGVGPNCSGSVPYAGPKPPFVYSAASVDPMRAFDPHLKLPYSLEWNVALERTISNGQTFRVTYVGSVGRRLLRDDVTTNPNPNTEQLFTSLYLTRNSAYSNYNGLHLQYQRRLSHGLQVLASYAWSHSLDLNSSNVTYEVPALPSTLYNIRQDYGNSDFDVRHVFSAALTYDIPTVKIHNGLVKALSRNWAISSNNTARTGVPFNVLYTPADAGSFQTTQGAFEFRPNVVPGQPVWIGDPTAPGGKRLNIAAFAIPAAAHQGTESRNSLRGFSLVELDLGLKRQFNITERANLQFRAEGFNVINHPNFSNPLSDMGVCSLGVPCAPVFGWGTSQAMLNQGLGSGNFHGTPLNGLYQAGGPRSLQVALKLQF
jgi:hypothetical protein